MRSCPTFLDTFPGALDGVRIRKGGTGRNSSAPAMHRAPTIFACRPFALPGGCREIRKESKLGMKISPQMSRGRQVTLPPCQGPPWSPRVPYLDFISQMHGMRVNSPHPRQHPTRSHGARQAGSISSQQVEKFAGSEEQIGPSEAPFPKHGELGARAVPTPPVTGLSGHLAAASLGPSSVHLYPKGGAFLEHGSFKATASTKHKGRDVTETWPGMFVYAIFK